MAKKSRITNLLVVPLIASTVFLSSPVFADNSGSQAPSVGRIITSESTTNEEYVPNPKKGISGTVVGVNGSIITVTGENNIQYTVEASRATIMKASSSPDDNPTIVHTGDVKKGDFIIVRGVISNIE